MMWLEVVHMRVTVHDSERLTSLLTDLLVEIRGKENCRDVKLFRRALLKNDICLHLYHDTEKAGAHGSPVGLHIVATLKPFGMVNHTVWTESGKIVSQSQDGDSCMGEGRK